MLSMAKTLVYIPGREWGREAGGANMNISLSTFINIITY